MSTTVYSQVLIYTAGASMERTKMPNLRNWFEPGLTWLRVRHSTAELLLQTATNLNATILILVIFTIWSHYFSLLFLVAVLDSLQRWQFCTSSFYVEVVLFCLQIGWGGRRGGRRGEWTDGYDQQRPTETAAEQDSEVGTSHKGDPT